MKQQLTEALAVLDDPANTRFTIRQIKESRRMVNTAARLVERLLPGVIHRNSPMGNGRCCSFCIDDLTACQVWDEGIVEAVTGALLKRFATDKTQAKDFIYETFREDARAALSALVELLTEKVET